MRYLNRPLLAAMFFACAPAPVAFAQAPLPPALLFRETWLQPPGAKPVGQGDGTDDVVTRLTAANLPIVVANKQLELKVYGKDGYLVRTAQHQGRNDLWSGMATTPVAVTLRHKTNYVDLTGLARVRWIVRTNSVSLLHPIVKLADGTYIVARRAIDTGGEFLMVELSFNDLKWFKLDPEKVVPGVEVKNPDLTRVDEIGMAYLAPGGGHGTASSINLSDVEVYAKPVPR
jgi:hypothetical protein